MKNEKKNSSKENSFVDEVVLTFSNKSFFLKIIVMQILYITFFFQLVPNSTCPSLFFLYNC